MSSSQSSIHKLWTRCIFDTASWRSRCPNRPSLYYTEAGTLVLDTRSMLPRDPELINAIVFTCSRIAGDYGFSQDMSVEFDDMYVWKKGGAA